MAWVVLTPLRACNGILDLFNLFLHVTLTLFKKLKQAVAWLQQTAPPEPPKGCFVPSRPSHEEPKLRYLLQRFAQQLGVTPTST